MGASFSKQDTNTNTNNSSNEDISYGNIYNKNTNSNFSNDNSMRTNKQKYDCLNECKQKCQRVSMGGKRMKSRRRTNKKRKSSRRK